MPIDVTAGSIHFIVTPSANAIAVGQPVNITVSAVNTCDVVQPSYSGTVHFDSSTDPSFTKPADYTFTVGMGADNGVHTFNNSFSFDQVGTQTVSATDTFNQFFGTSPDIDVTMGNTTVLLAPLPKQFIFRQPVTLTATVHVTAPAAGSSTGTVSFYDGAVLLGSSPVASNQATFTATQLKIGKHSFTAVYNGDANFNASPSSPVVVQYKSPKPR